MDSSGAVLVIAPHPDDEVLGAGGTMARLSSEGHEVFVLIVTRADPSIFPDYSVEEGRAEALEADELLGVRKTLFLEGFPAALLDTVPQAHLNRAVGEVIEQIGPRSLLIPFVGDLHMDHRKVAEAALVAARPDGTHTVRSIWAYETVSETNWNAAPFTPGFLPNTFVDISGHLEPKLEAMRRYASQLKPFPHERSLEALEARARSRGATVGFNAAEAFVLIRQSI